MKDNSDVRTMVRSAYDLQKLRIAQGNRLVGQLKAKLGQAPSMPEDNLSEESKKLLALLRTNNKLLADGAVDELEKSNVTSIKKGKKKAEEVEEEVDENATATEKAEKKTEQIINKLIDIEYPKFIKMKKVRKAKGQPSDDISTEEEEALISHKKFIGNAVISTFTELCLIQQYKEILVQEKAQFARLQYVLGDFPIFTKFLKNVRGIGPAMAGVIISEFNVEAAQYASSFVKYAGIDVVRKYNENGEMTYNKGRGRLKEQLVQRPYITKEGKEDVKDSITFSPFVKTKLIGVLAPSFLRAGGEYADLYRNYKSRIENHPDHVSKTKLHRHRMALRYMVKIFLQNLWVEWRAIEGLPVTAPYHVRKLNMSDHGLEQGLIERHGHGFASKQEAA